MSKVFIAQATERGTLKFKSDFHTASFTEWLKERPNRDVRITDDDSSVSDNMRGYYFGAVLPEVRKTCDKWKDLTGDELHEVLKKEYAYFEAWSQKNKRIERFSKKVMSDDKDNETAKQFLMDISDYLAQCGKTMPDPKKYKEFINSAPLKNE